MIIDDFFKPKLTVAEASAANDYFTRRKSEEDRIAGVKAPAKNKKNPANTDYAKKRKQQDVTEAGHDHRRRAAASHDDEECSSCDGTGEGRHEGQSCGACGGSGVARGQYDHDDFDIPDKDDMYEDVAKTLPMSDAVKVLRQYGADHFKTTSNELHFYKNGRPFSVDLIWNDDATRSVSLSQLNSATRRLKGQGVAEAKQEQTYKVYIQDTDGSERLGGTFVAKSPAHTRELAKKQGVKNITSIELKQGVKKGVAEAFPNPGSGNTGSSKEDKRIAAALRKKHIPTTPNDKKEQGVAEGKPQKKADRYHINKDGKPATLASYPDKDSAVKDRDSKYPDAKVHQVGPRGKVKGEFEEGVAEGKDEKIAQLKKDHDTAVHWSKNETSPQKREAARRKAEKIKSHLEKQYKQGVAEGRVAQLPTHGADYSKYDTDHLKTMLRPGILHRDEARFKSLIRQELKKREQQSQQGVAEAVWDRPSQSYVPRDGRTFGQTNHPREEHCDFCGAATGHAGTGEDSIEDDEGNVYCDDCYADQQGVAEGEEENIDQFISGNSPNFNGESNRVSADTAQYNFINFLEKKGFNVDYINDQAYPVLVAICQGKMCAWYDFKNAHGYVSEQGVAEGLSKRDQKDVAAIKAAIERLESQLKQPNADKESIQQSIAHERKRLALYKQGVAESNTLMKKLHQALLKEGRVKELADDLKTLNDTEFMKKYGKAKAAIRKDMKKLHEAVSTLSPEQLAYNQLRAQIDSANFLRGGNTANTVVNTTPEVQASQANMNNKLAQMAAALKAKGIDAAAEYDAPEPGAAPAQPVDLNQKYNSKNKVQQPVIAPAQPGVAEARMSAAQRLSTAWDRQRAKSDASLARTPGSIPKKQEPKKADTNTKTVSEHRVQRRTLMAQMLNGH